MKLLRFIRRSRLDAECAREIDSYLEAETGENIARGMAPQEALAAARRKFGNRSIIREQVYHRNSAIFFDAVWRDLRYAVRTMRQNPAFAAAAMITLALGIGANTAIFTVVRAVLLKPLEFHDPDRLVFFSVATPKRTGGGRFARAEFDDIRAGAKSFEAIAAYGVNPENISIASGRGEPEALRAARVSGNFLDVLGVRPILGRGFVEQEDTRGGPDVAMISAELWQRRFAGNTDIAGTTAALDSKMYTIIGVLPPGFAFPFAGADVWLTRPSEWSALPSRFWGIPLLNGFARLRPGVPLERARAEMQVLHAQYLHAHPALLNERDSAARVVWLKERLIADVRVMLWMLFGAVAFVLLIACANVASLLVARALARSQELAVRAALGAARGRLATQLLAESLVLSVLGGALGVVVANWGLRAIHAMGSFDRSSGNALFLPGGGAMRLDGTVLAFTLVLSLATGILFGLFPSLQLSRPDLAGVLRDRGEGRASPARRGGLSARSVLVAAQVAMSVVLLIGSALLIQSIARLRSVHPGFRAAKLLSLKVSLPGIRYDTGPRRWAFFEELVRRVEALPGVSGAGVALSLPTTTNNLGTNVDIEGQPHVDAVQQPIAQLQSVSPGYFRAMGIRLLRGREFTAADNRTGAAPVIIINESFARRFWPDYPRGIDPVGQHMGEGADKIRSAEIVGIVADVRERALALDPEPEFYVTAAVHPPQTAYLAVRTDGDPLSWANAVRGQLRAVDRDQAVSEISSMDAVLDKAMGGRRLVMRLVGIFAGLALLLTLIGIYGITSYSVTQRTQEVGIRRALGAQHGDVLRLVLKRSIAVAGSGIAIGIGSAMALTRILKEFLFQVSATDPAVFAGIGLLFMAAAVIASLIPALRAARVDPMTALRACIAVVAVLSASCATRRAAEPFRVIPAQPSYLLRSPDLKETPFPEVPALYTGVGPGWVDVRPWMRVRVENAYFREGAPRRGLQGFIGTQVAEYRALGSGSLHLLSVQSKVPQVPKDQLPVQALLPQWLARNRFHRFFYQIVFRTRGDARGAGLLGAQAAAELDTLTANLSADPAAVCGGDSRHCVVFPEACTVSLEMEIVVNGSRRSILWSTLLLSVAPHPRRLELLRMHAGRPTPVQLDPRDPNALRLPLLPGDRVTWE